MIIEMYLTVIYNVLEFLTTPIDIPNMPDDVYSYVNELADLFATGGGILANYVRLDYILLLFGIIVAIDVGVAIYHFVMWVIRKIPMLGMS